MELTDDGLSNVFKYQFIAGIVNFHLHSPHSYNLDLVDNITNYKGQHIASKDYASSINIIQWTAIALF